MKNKFYLLAITICIAASAQSQSTADFESFSIPSDSFWNGNDGSGGFTEAGFFFQNSYHQPWSFWDSGWAVSTKKDTLTADASAQYYARAGSGYLSETYAVGQQYARISVLSPFKGKQIRGAYFTNTTYDYHTLKDGNQFAKKFGGVDGNDPDFFVLTVKAWFQGQLTQDSVNFFLADYRNADNSKDYIVKDWTWVDLSSLGNADSLFFEMHSSDTGAFGINTPLFFCMDNLTIEDFGTRISKQASLPLNIYPNPAGEKIQINLDEDNLNVSFFDANGRLVRTFDKENEFLVSDLPAGMYFIKAEQNGTLYTGKIIKN